MAAEAQQSVTLRDLNTYSTPIEFGNGDEIGSQPLIDVDVTFTAVVASNPRSSGLSSYNSDDNSIDRAHVFIIDTTALGSGREGMGMQIVETDVEFVEGLVRGGIYTFRGTLSPYFSTAQFDLTEQPVEVLAREVKTLRNKEIPLVKVLWRNHRVEEATWEREDDMRSRYPELFEE